MTFENEPTTPGGLPRGPGRTIRWCAAIPLLLIGFVGVPLAVFAELEWASYLAVNRLYGHASYAPDATELSVLIQIHALLYTVVLVLWVMLRRWPRPWPALSPIVSVPISLATFVTYDDFPSQVRVNAFERFVIGTPFLTGAVAIAVSLATTYGAALVLTRPLAFDVVDGRFDIVVPLRGTGGKERLRIRRELLRLEKLSFPDGEPRRSPQRAGTRVQQQSIELGEVHRVELGQFESPSDHRLPNGAVVTLSPGPGLRVVGSRQQWPLPLDTPETVSAVINRRASTAPAAVSLRARGGLAFLLVGVVGVAGTVAASAMAFSQAERGYVLAALFYAAIGIGGLVAFSSTVRGVRRARDTAARGRQAPPDDPPPTWRATR